jgi:hypothetical protein
VFLVVSSLPSPWSSFDVLSSILLSNCYGFFGHPFMFLVVLFLTIVVVVVVLLCSYGCLFVLFLAITLVLVVLLSY